MFVCGVAKGYCDGTDVSWMASAGLDWIGRQCEEPDGDVHSQRALC